MSLLRAWSFVALLAAAGAFSCGRIGFEPLGEDAGRLPDASAERDSARDAPADAPVVEDVTVADSPADAPGAPDASTDADASCVVSATVDYCTALPPLPAPPVIDGVLDCGPALVAAPPVDWSGP